MNYAAFEGGGQTDLAEAAESVSIGLNLQRG
jgi:hypothetical protein